MTQSYLPPTSFYFELTILGTPTSPWSRTDVDGSFQEISGIDRELEVQALPEGGENGFTHQLPKRGKHPNLVLRRGIVPSTSALAAWAETSISSDFSKPIQVQDLLVTLMGGLDETQEKPKAKLIVWTFTNAYPVKWSTSGFKAMDNALAVETLEMAYATVKREIKDNG